MAALKNPAPLFKLLHFHPGHPEFWPQVRNGIAEELA
jgi:hypothetical protein